MALGRRRGVQAEVWIPVQEIPRSPGHPFYLRLNQLLAEAGFDSFVEQLCKPYYAEHGRPSIPPGIYFRMLVVGYFEGINAQRAIAWRCSDSLSLREFLGFGPTGETPDHSSLTVIRQRLPLEVHEQVFTFILRIAREKGLLKGKTIAVDSTTLEANAAMKSIVRKDSGEEWKDYLKRLAQEAGIKNPTQEEARRHDRRRRGKKVSNQDWESPSDPDSRIARMKDGTTHLAYKAEHAVDVESNLVVAAVIHHADQADHQTLAETVAAAQVYAEEAGVTEPAREVVADKGYHASETLTDFAAAGLRTYIPEPKLRGGRRRWTNKTEAQKRAVLSNRRRVRGERGKRLSRQRSEKSERSIAHTCETGGGRRAWLRGIEEVAKRHLIHVGAYNLGVVMRQLFGVGTPRSLQGAASLALSLAIAIWMWVLAHVHRLQRAITVLFGTPWFVTLMTEPLRAPRGRVSIFNGLLGVTVGRSADMGRLGLWVRHLGTLDEKPEDYRHLSEIERHRDARNESPVLRQDHGCNTTRQIGEARNHQQDPQEPRKEARLDYKDTERQKPKTPERHGNSGSTAMKSEKAQRQSVQLRFAEHRQVVGATQEYQRCKLVE